jgi:hypothetical protein
MIALAKGTAIQLSASVDVLTDLAEVRRAKESAALFADAPAHEQAQWVADLKKRTVSPPKGAPAV